MIRLVKGKARKSELIAQLVRGSHYGKEEKLIVNTQGIVNSFMLDDFNVCDIESGNLESIKEVLEDVVQDGGFRDVYVYCNLPDSQEKNIVELAQMYSEKFHLTFTIQTDSPNGAFELIEIQ